MMTAGTGRIRLGCRLRLESATRELPLPFSVYGLLFSAVARIYLDHAATTPLLPEVKDAMRSSESNFGNPSSLCAEGRAARQAIDATRENIAAALGCEFGEVIFTSSGTEAANLAILGTALSNEDADRTRIVLSAAEHHSVLQTGPLLSRFGYRVDLARVDKLARTDLDRLRTMMGPDVLLVAAMSANNETGTKNDVETIASMAHDVGALYFCDRIQELERIGSEDLACFAAHKLNGPKGAGALYIRAGSKLRPLIVGGGQEREMRAGTENVSAISGFGIALQIHFRRRAEFEEKKNSARNAFLARVRALQIPHLHITANPKIESVLPGHAHLRIGGRSAETMLIKLDRLGVSASSGAACSSGSIEPSHALLASGWDESSAREALRFSFGITNTLEEAAEAANLLAQAGQ